MNKREQSAETTNEQSTEAQVTNGSHSNGNTNVVGSFSPISITIGKKFRALSYNSLVELSVQEFEGSLCHSEEGKSHYRETVNDVINKLQLQILSQLEEVFRNYDNKNKTFNLILESRLELDSQDLSA